MLSDCCLSVSLSCPVCNVGALWPNSWTDQYETWHAGLRVGLSPGHIVLDGNPAPLPKGAQPPNFRPIAVAAKWLHGSRCHLVWGRPLPRRLYVRWGPSPLPKRGRSSLPNFRRISIVAKMPLGMEVGLIPRDFVRWGPSPLPTKGVESPNFSAHVYCSYCDFVRTLHSCYWFVQVQVLVLYAFYF